MNVEDAIAPPETNNQVEIYGDQDAPEGMYSGFVGANASYFAQAADEDGVMDVDCAILEANQQSLSGCLTALD